MSRRFGKYIIDKKIAIGGMAEIYRAHTTSGQAVAIKLILPNYASQPKFVQMFLDEARIVIGLRHPNIVQMLDFGRVKDTYFFSMEWIDGKPLSEIIRKQLTSRFRFPVDVALLLTFDICQGLDYAHNRSDRFDRPLNIIHRDISPPNVMVTRAAEAKIADFGIAFVRDKGVQTKPGIIRGKFSYMSPEQSFGKDIDHRSDVFSVGVVLHELLAGQRLFLRENETKTIEAVRECKVPMLRTHRDDIPEAVEQIVAKALAKDVRKRYASANAMAQDITVALKRNYPQSGRQTIAEFLKVLFPKEEFVGANRPVHELVERWREDSEARLPVPSTRTPRWVSMIQDHRWIASIILIGAAIIIAEFWARYSSGR